MSNSLAPITLFVYNRPWHTRRAVEALRGNELADESDLFVFSDGPRANADSQAVQEVREYIRSITGFHRVTMIERDRNLGLAQSIISSVTETVNKFGRIIVLEDDIVTSPYFLKYMNEALEFYKDKSDVISVHGYLYPVKAQLPETFFLKGADCWGWATWKRGWDLFEADGRELLTEIQKKNAQEQFDFDGAYPWTKMLQDQIDKKNDSWAVRWYASAFIKEKLTLYPGSSLVQNIGNDSSGTHTGNTNIFFTKLAESKVNIMPIPLREDSVARSEVRSFLKSIRPGLAKRFGSKLIGYLKDISL
jgi:hypothetical protein